MYDPKQMISRLREALIFLQRLQNYSEIIHRHSTHQKISPFLVSGIVIVESSGIPTNFNPNTWAAGLMGVMPKDTPREDLKKYFADRPTRDQLMADPELNIQWGTSILADKIRRYGLVEGLQKYSGNAPGYANKVLGYSKMLLGLAIAGRQPCWVDEDIADG